MRRITARFVVVFVVGLALAAPTFAQAPATPAPAPAPAAQTPPTLPEGITPPADYVIGADDILAIVFWRDADMSGEVVVRPDGKISLPLLNDVHAAGLTPDQLRQSLTESAAKYIEAPTVSVVVKKINSRLVFITGQVGKPGPYPLMAPTTVLQIIATAGGLGEYADSEKVQVIRTESGKTVSLKFNYKDFIKGKNMSQNIELKPGDTIIVP